MWCRGAFRIRPRQNGMPRFSTILLGFLLGLVLVWLGWRLAREGTEEKPFLFSPSPEWQAHLASGRDPFWDDSLEEMAVVSMLPGDFSEGNTPGVGGEAVPGESLVTFRSREALAAFLKRARAQGLSVLGVSDALRSLRIGGLRSAVDQLLGELPQGEAWLENNFIVRLPDSPDSPEKREGLERILPFGNHALAWLGVTAGSNVDWGRGVTIAVLDTAVESAHLTFGRGQISVLVLENSGASGTQGSSLHGTAVASILGGQHEQARGVAPSAHLLSVPLLGEDGTATSFDLAAAIVAATDAGADIINISLGGYGDSRVVRDAVAYATERDVLIVAAAGNETYAELAYPARYPEVLAVGAVDGYGQQLPFSNSGPSLDLAAPGLAVQAAAGDRQITSFSGTSASTPFVSGAVAAVLSEFSNLGLTPREAADLLVTYANEAGLPGADSAYGQGILDLGRVMRSAQAGVVDAAIASVIPAVDSAGNPAIQIVVENRGTSALQNLRVSVAVEGRPLGTEFLLPYLEPNGVGVSQMRLPNDLLGPGESLRIRSEVTQLPGDILPGNNLYQGMLRF